MIPSGYGIDGYLLSHCLPVVFAHKKSELTKTTKPALWWLGVIGKSNFLSRQDSRYIFVDVEFALLRSIHRSGLLQGQQLGCISTLELNKIN